MTVQVLTTQPNWTTPVLERLEWRTDVIKSRDGTEQRIKLRENPRHLMEYDFLIARGEYRALQVQLLRWQSSLWVTPLWMHTQQITVAAPINSTRIHMPATDTYEYQVGSHLYLSISPTQYEYRPVFAIGPDYVDLAAPTTQAWPVGTSVTPARYGRIASSIKMQAITGDIVSGNFQINIENTNSFDTVENELIDGLLYFSLEPNRSSPVDISWMRNQGVLDYGTGPITAYDLQGYSEITRAYTYLSLNRKGQNRARSLLNHCKGMRSPFLLPSFQADIAAVPNQILSSDNNTLDIESVNYTNDMFSRITHPYLRLELWTGPILIKKVSNSVILNNDIERLSFSKPFGCSFISKDIKRISYVNMSRLDSDAVEFSWLTPSVVSMSITARGIPE